MKRLLKHLICVFFLIFAAAPASAFQKENITINVDGNDVTDLVLNTENLLMFTSHDLSKVTEEEWEKMREITEAAAKKDFVVLWTVAAEPEVVDSLRAKYDFVYDVYLADELEIKTIVRSNPGLIWLDNGLVKDKWSVFDFSKALKAF